MPNDDETNLRAQRGDVMDPIKVLVVDDHPIVRLGIRIVLEDDPLFVVCGEADTVSGAYEKIGELDPAIVILDLLLGPSDGINFIRSITELNPAMRVIVYSCQHEDMAGLRARRAGAHGYVSKIDGLPQIAKALAAVSQGGLFFYGARQKNEEFLHRHDEQRMLRALSNREMQVLQLTGQGLSLQDIARELSLSTKTVGTYRERLKIKLGVDRVQELIWLSQDLIARKSIGPERIA